MLTFESTVHKQRFSLGVICGLLPILCVLFGLISCTIGNNPWSLLSSISETYWSNHNSIMIIALGLCGFFLFTYQGYDLGDKVLTLIAGVGALGVAFVPCRSDIAPEYVGLLSLPVWTSNTVHFIFATMVFGGFTLMTLTQFTKGSNKKRNRVYIICGIVMLIALLLVPVKNTFGWPTWTMMLLEFIMLEAFSVSWIVKSKVAIQR